MKKISNLSIEEIQDEMYDLEEAQNKLDNLYTYRNNVIDYLLENYKNDVEIMKVCYNNDTLKNIEKILHECLEKINLLGQYEKDYSEDIDARYEECDNMIDEIEEL